MDKRSILIFVLILIIIGGGVFFFFWQKSNSAPSINSSPTACAELSENFDILNDMGCIAIANDGELVTTAGARIVNIGSAQVIVEAGIPNNDYHYRLTLKGQSREGTFTLVTSQDVEESSLELSAGDASYMLGDYYQFDFRDLCGLVYSSGPHGGGRIFVDNNLTALQSKSC